MLVDNLGKNMVLTTFGMNAEGNVIWYPSFDIGGCKTLFNWLGSPEEDDRGQV